MANKIKLRVGGMEYIIHTDDDEAYMQNLGNEVNRRLDQLAQANPFLSTTMVAVLAALEYCDNAKKSQIDADSLRAQLRGLTEDAAGARLEADEARREIERLNRENQNLRSRLLNR